MTMNENTKTFTREEQETMLAELGLVAVANDYTIHTVKFEWCEECQEMHGTCPEGLEMVAMFGRRDLLKLRQNINDYAQKLVDEQGPMSLLTTQSNALN